MFSLLLAVSLAGLVFVGVAIPFPPNYAILPAVAVLVASYILLARRHLKAVEEVMQHAAREVGQQRIDHAIRILQGGYVHSRWVFLLKGQLDGQVGCFHYLQKDFEAALPLLEGASARHWMAKGMLAAYYFKHHKPEKAFSVIDRAVTFSKKEALLHGMKAWMKVKLKDRDGAREVLIASRKALPKSEAIAQNLVRLQNGEDLRMSDFGEAWWQFHLEKPSQKMLMKLSGQQGMRPRGMKKSMNR